MNQTKTMALVGLATLLILASFSMFIVKETDRAILFRLGETVRTDYEPGLHFKIPFVNNVRKFDARIMTLDVEPERYLTSEKKNVIVDAFVKWRIDDVARFYTSVRGDEAQGAMRLSQIIKDSLRGEFGKRTIKEVISGERGQIMELVTVGANKQAQEFGINIIDVRLKSTPGPLTRIRTSMRSIAAWRPIAHPSRIAATSWWAIRKGTSLNSSTTPIPVANNLRVRENGVA